MVAGEMRFPKERGAERTIHLTPNNARRSYESLSFASRSLLQLSPFVTSSSSAQS